jgi:hypothetical protein
MGLAVTWEAIMKSFLGVASKADQLELEELLRARCEGVPTNSCLLLKFHPLPASGSDAKPTPRLVLRLLQHATDVMRAPMTKGLALELWNGRAMQTQNVHAVVTAVAHAGKAYEGLLDDALTGKAGSVSVQQHRLAILASLVELAVSRPVPYIILSPALHSQLPLLNQRYSWVYRPLTGAFTKYEHVVVAILTVPELVADLVSSPSGADLRRLIRSCSPTRIQIIDSVHLDITSRALSLLLPPLETASPLTAFFAPSPDGGGCRSDLSVLLLDVETWRILCHPMALDHTSLKAPPTAWRLDKMTHD